MIHTSHTPAGSDLSLTLSPDSAADSCDTLSDTSSGASSADLSADIIKLYNVSFYYAKRPQAPTKLQPQNRHKPNKPLSRARAALHDISVSIPKHKISAVLGPNGAGKSTMLDICLGWKPPFAGSVELHGYPMDHYSRKEMGKIIGLVPQNEQLQFDYSLLEYVLLGRAPYLKQLELPGKHEVSIAKEALAQVGIGHLTERRVTQLSGGEHQLLMIARSLAQQPDLLILDEPTSQLDPGNRLRLVKLIQELNRQGKTILFTTHDPSLAAILADHIILLKNGILLAEGEKEKALQSELLSELYDVSVTVTTLADKRVVLY